MRLSYLNFGNTSYGQGGQGLEIIWDKIVIHTTIG